MHKILLASLLLSLTGCVPMTPVPAEPSACALGESSYACQIERYNKVNVD